MRFLTAAIFTLLATAYAADELPSNVEVKIEPAKFGDTASILQVDSTVASFQFDRPVQHLALVLESRPKEPRQVSVARLDMNLAKPVTEGRFCVQMVDQSFLPLGNGSPNQMQLFMQFDCGGTLLSSSQSFLKEKFSFSKSRARSGSGTQVRKVSGGRVPVFWIMGNSDSGTYFNDEDLEKMMSRNRDAFVLIGYLEVAKDATAPPVQAVTQAPKPPSPPPTDGAVALIGPPFPVPTAPQSVPAPATPAKPTSPPAATASKASPKTTSTKSSKTTPTKKKKR